MRSLRWLILAAAAALLTIQLFVPPIVGLADNGDYYRTIGRFGYGPEHRGDLIAYVPRKFIPDPTYRFPYLDHVESEYLFAGSAVLLNKLISRDGKLDITVIGFLHALAFLLTFARLLAVTAGSRWTPFVWLASLFILTDVGYVAYWNSFFSEPSACIFFLLLVADSVAIIRTGAASPTQMVRWSLWAILFVGAKSQTFPFAILLAPLALRFGFLTKSRPSRYLSITGAALIVITAIFNVSTAPKYLTSANTYNVIFMAILPESKNPAADLQSLGLQPSLIRYSGSGAWTPNTAFPSMLQNGDLRPAAVARFWLFHPRALWRRAKSTLPVAFSLRPEWSGNFERSTGREPGARAKSFRFWSLFHERIITKLGKFLLVLLVLSPLAAILAWTRLPRRRLFLEGLGVLSACCIMAFLVAIGGDAWDNVKHLFLFNLLLDTLGISSTTLLLSIVYRRKSAL